jgi:transcription elongation GreA/GreB family factor
MGQATQEMRLLHLQRPLDVSVWCSERRAMARAAVGMVVSVTDDVGRSRRWLLAETGGARTRRRWACGGAEQLGPLDPRHQAVVGKAIGDREMYQWGGRVREVRVDSIEPGLARSGRLRSAW